MLIGFRKPPKLDYYFIMSAIFVPVAHHWTETANTASTFLEMPTIISHMFRLYKCACVNIEAAKLQREKLSFKCVQNERKFELSTFFPALVL